MSTAEAYALCRRVARQEAKNFYWAFRVLPRAKSNAMCAVYAFMRRADDLADDKSRTIEERRRLTAEWTKAWLAAEAGNSTSDAIFVALLDTQQRFGIPGELLRELIRGTMMDLEPKQLSSEGFQMCQTFDELYEYCYLVASVVGLVCIRIFGYSDPRAEELAEKTGIAFQLTNVLRDVKEDVEMGRIYLPTEIMQEFGMSHKRVEELATGATMSATDRAVLAVLGGRAEAYYRAADELIPMLDRDSRAAMWVLATIYRRLLDRIRRRGGDVFKRRITVPASEKLWILMSGARIALWNLVRR